ncbi:MAG: carbamoyltransferase HypF [Gammaproteobacteria bacterium]|nr:carbamoyltransferase HypF [Gammaproteobacteria bacterium]
MQVEPQAPLTIKIIGIVQGIGCRPAIKRLADEYQLRGWVRNNGREVEVFVQAEAKHLGHFHAALVKMFAQQSVILQDRRLNTIHNESQQNSAVQGFAIKESTGEPGALAITPDLALCGTCRAELFDKANRRYQYPFISCTQCGSRYSISTSAPFDRERTKLKAFKPCDSCTAEYTNPRDRRFHAQTIACQCCGPQLNLLDAHGNTVHAPGAWQDYARKTLIDGGIIAIKTAGGFQLYALASNSQAIQKIRKLKQRPYKPFALLMPGIAQLEQYCLPGAAEKALLCSPIAPLVIVRSRKNSAGDIARLADNVAPKNPYIAAMLPHHPLQHLLMQVLDEALVATSANRSGEALIADDEHLLQAFTGELDLIVTHNLPIHRPLDDSIFQVIDDRPMCLRAGRGVAPIVIDLARHIDQAKEKEASLLALGAQLKNSIAVSHNNKVILSQYHGDLENISVLDRQQQTLRDYTLANARSLHVIVDAHPRRPAIIDALEVNTTSVVQHHEAHARACQLEHAIKEPHLAVVWDGFGFGSEACMWGGEFFLIHNAALSPFAQLAELELLGGDRAMHEPRRMALAALWPLYGDKSFDKLDGIWRKKLFTEQEQKLLKPLLRKSRMTTRAAGRWFDAVACLLRISEHNRFEADAAMQLQYLAEHAVGNDEAYRIEIKRGETAWTIDFFAVAEQILSDNSALPIKAMRFHNTLAETIARMADKAKVKAVSLSGGCFQNRLLLELCRRQLERKHIRCFWPEKIPINDGGIAAGQILAGILHEAGSAEKTENERVPSCV